MRGLTGSEAVQSATTGGSLSLSVSLLNDYPTIIWLLSGS